MKREMFDEVQRLLDEAEIVAVAQRYCRVLDEGDFAGLADVFVPDATAVLGDSGELRDLDAITDRCRAALSPLDGSQHMVSNHEVDVVGDTATHRCYVQAQHVRRDAAEGATYVLGGRYEDRLERTDDGWRIVHRDLITMWQDGNIGVVLGDRPPKETQ